MRSLIIAVVFTAFTAGCCTRVPEAPREPLAAPSVPVEHAQVHQRVAVGVAEALGIEPSALELVHLEAETWPDASLGCPEPGKLYAQVTTPGWRLRFSRPGGDVLEVHSNRDGDHWTLCARGGRHAPGDPPQEG